MRSLLRASIGPTRPFSSTVVHLHTNHRQQDHWSGLFFRRLRRDVRTSQGTQIPLLEPRWVGIWLRRACGFEVLNINYSTKTPGIQGPIPSKVSARCPATPPHSRSTTKPHTLYSETTQNSNFFSKITTTHSPTKLASSFPNPTPSS
jgi:hypothetical protein